MTPEELQNLRDLIRETEEVFALYGYEPTDASRAITEAVLAGRVTMKQASNELSDYIDKYKTDEGFVESRAWP